MNTIRNLLRNVRSVSSFVLIILLTVLLSISVAAESAKSVEKSKDQSSIVTGSGKGYQTTVERQTTGELSDQDMHQASLLTSRIVKHLNEAVQGLLDQNSSAAKAEIEKAESLVKVVRSLLPVTTATTIVKDAAGKEVYRDVDKVQADRIPLYNGMIAMEVVEPIVDAKSTEASLKGLRLANANVINTAVLANLSYIERKLARAAALIDKPADALTHLTLAQTHGIELVVNQSDTPLVQVQQALRLAERMVEEGKHEAARDNLKIAQVQLGLYRAVLGKEAGQVVKQLEDDISGLMAKTEEKGAAEKIRVFWERTVKLFRQEPGQAQVVNKESAVQIKPAEKSNK